MNAIEYAVEEAVIALLKFHETLADKEITRHDDNAEDEEFAGIMVSAEVESAVTRSSTNALGRRVDDLEVSIDLRGLIFDVDHATVSGLWRAINDALLKPEAGAAALPEFAPETTSFRTLAIMGEVTSKREDQEERRTHVRIFKIRAGLGVS